MSATDTFPANHRVPVEGYATLELGELAARPVRVDVSPAPSLFAVAADLAGASRGVPGDWIAAARAQLTSADLEALAPLGAQPGECSPGRVACGSVDVDNIADEIDRIASLPVDSLLEDIDFACGPDPTPRWDSVRRRPRRWLVSYACALVHVWNAIREPWEAASTLVDREQRRVETAAGEGTMRELPEGIDVAEVCGGNWCFPASKPLPLRVPDGGLTLKPVIAGAGAFGFTYQDDGLVTSIIYPLPGWTGIVRERHPSPKHALEALVGAQRATILRELSEPRTAGRLATALGATPGAATHHLRALESAGLIVRERAGRMVVVHRTGRGSRLLRLYREA